METVARKKLLLAVQTSGSGALRLDSAGRTGKYVSRREGQMKEDNRILDVVGTSRLNLRKI